VAKAGTARRAVPAFLPAGCLQNLILSKDLDIIFTGKQYFNPATIPAEINLS
jgi:hypothetical protein